MVKRFDNVTPQEKKGVSWIREAIDTLWLLFALIAFKFGEWCGLSDEE